MERLQGAIILNLDHHTSDIPWLFLAKWCRSNVVAGKQRFDSSYSMFMATIVKSNRCLYSLQDSLIRISLGTIIDQLCLGLKRCRFFIMKQFSILKIIAKYDWVYSLLLYVLF